MRFLEKRFSTQKEKITLQDFSASLCGDVAKLEYCLELANQRISSLEQKFESYESIPSDTKMVNAAIKYAEASKKGKSKDKEILGKRIENIANELEKIKNEKNPFKYSNKDAIIDILNKHRGQKLVCQAVYAKLKTYNTKKPHVPLTSVRATLYWMAREKISGIKLCDETETARFFIEKE